MPELVAATPDERDDARHVRAARHGSQAAYAWLYRRYAPLVHGILLGRVRPAMAEELTQECFATAFARLPQLRDDDRFGAWIAVMARRVRAAARAPEVQIDTWPEIASTASGPEDSSDARQVLRALATLPETYRITLTLRLVDGLGGPEIAALTGLTPESVRVNLHRGMEKLRAALQLPRTGRTGTP